MRRFLQPELLDHLPPSSPWVTRSRADLRRINAIMGNADIVAKAFFQHKNMEVIRERSLRICEIGAGDGSLLLELARSWSVLGMTAEAELIDLHYLITEQTLHAFTELDWHATQHAVDVMTWLDQSQEKVDVMIANLFLHHFDEPTLRELFERAAARTSLFIACEPRRSKRALAASHLVGLIGCGTVTRHDAVVSVRGGFDGEELSALWPDSTRWSLTEDPVGPFSHCFIAKFNG